MADDYKVYKCVLCGFEYDEAKGLPNKDIPAQGIPAGTRWKDVPEDWLCPECGVGKDEFEMIKL